MNDLGKNKSKNKLATMLKIKNENLNEKFFLKNHKIYNLFVKQSHSTQPI